MSKFFRWLAFLLGLILFLTGSMMGDLRRSPSRAYAMWATSPNTARDTHINIWLADHTFYRRVSDRSVNSLMWTRNGAGILYTRGRALYYQPLNSRRTQQVIDRLLEDDLYMDRYTSDGEWIIVPRMMERSIHLYRLRYDGSQVDDITPTAIIGRIVTDSLYLDHVDRLLFQACEDGQRCYLYRLRLDGTALEQLAHVPVPGLFLCHENEGTTWLIYCGQDDISQWRAYALEVEQGKFHLLRTNIAPDERWEMGFADETSVIYKAQGHLIQTALDGTWNKPLGLIGDSHPLFPPHQNTLMYYHNNVEAGSFALYRLHLDTLETELMFEEADAAATILRYLDGWLLFALPHQQAGEVTLYEMQNGVVHPLLTLSNISTRPNHLIMSPDNRQIKLSFSGLETDYLIDLATRTIRPIDERQYRIGEFSPLIDLPYTPSRSLVSGLILCLLAFIPLPHLKRRKMGK